MVYLLRLNLCFVDLNTYKTAWKAYKPDAMANILRSFCQEEDTVNTRSGERVRVLWVNQSQGEIIHYGFDSFSEWMLPVDRDTIRKERNVKEKCRQSFQLLKRGRIGNNLRPSSNRQLAWDRLEDLRTLARLRAWTEKGVPHGYSSHGKPR